MLFSEPEFAIYKIVHRATGRGYIGLTSQGVAVRYRRHWNASKREDSVLYRAFRKYGRKAFYVVTLAMARSGDDLPGLEQRLIAEHRTFVNDGGFNMTRGGEGSPVICEEVRENMRRAAKERVADPAVRQKISNSLRGRKLSPEHIAASALGRAGKPLSAAHKLKISESNKRRPPPSTEQKAAISAALTGRKLGESHIANASAGLRRSYAAATPEMRALRSAALRAGWVKRKARVNGG